MIYTRRMVEADIAAKMGNAPLSRIEALAELLEGATEGAGKAERTIILNREKITQSHPDANEERKRLFDEIAAADVVLSMETQRKVLYREAMNEQSQ